MAEIVFVETGLAPEATAHSTMKLLTSPDPALNWSVAQPETQRHRAARARHIFVICMALDITQRICSGTARGDCATFNQDVIAPLPEAAWLDVCFAICSKRAFRNCCPESLRIGSFSP